MKRGIIVSLASILIFTSINIQTVKAGRTALTLEYGGEVHYYEEEDVALLVNGVRIDNFGGDMPPIILNDRVYLPVRDIFEMLNATVTWNGDTGQVYIGYGGTVVALRDGSEYINVDGVLMQMPLPPKIINGRMMAPISFVASAFGFVIEWVGDARTVTITGGSAANPDNDPGALETPGLDPDETPVLTGRDGIDEFLSPLTATNSAIDENVGTGPAALEKSVDADPEPLPAQSFPKTEIAAIEFDEFNPSVFYIRATGPISRVEKMILYDNRLVLDIYEAEKTVEETSFPTEGCPYLRGVRMGQNQIEPVMITRVVFDLDEPVSYSVSFSEDRQTLIVAFIQNNITDVSFRSDGYADYISIYGDIVPAVNVFPQTVENTLIIDIPLGIINSPTFNNVNGVFARAMRTEQFSPAAARVLLEMNEAASYDVTYEANSAIIRLFKPTYQNIVYDSASSRLIIPKTTGLQLDISKIAHSDEYLKYQYAFILPGNFNAYLGEGDYVVKDQYINRINISTANNRTSIRFYEQQVMAFEVTEDDNNIYIHAMLPKDKYDKIVVIDPGHGGSDPGTIHNGATEKDINLDIAVKLVRLLENSGVKAYMTRTGDTYPSREERAAFANEIGDLFISLHNNSSTSTGTTGTEVYYYPHDNDQTVGFTSIRAAELMLLNIVAASGAKAREFKENNYRVLTLTEIPAVLCEFGFLTNASEAAKLKTDDYRQKCAAGAFNGIMEIFKEYKPRR